MVEKIRVLILGASGFLGLNIYDTLSKKYECLGTYHSAPLKNFVKLDITKKYDVQKLISEFQPEVIINAITYKTPDKCEKEEESARKVYIEGTQNIMDSADKKIKIVHFSTDHVFDGKKGNYKEEDDVNPLNNYATLKLESEKLLLESNKEYVVFRISTLYGINESLKDSNFLKFVIDNLFAGKKINAFFNEQRTPTLIDDVSNAILFALEHNLTGLYHVSGPEKISYYDFAHKIAKRFNLDEKLIIKSERRDMSAKRPKDSSLNIEKITKRGIKMSNIIEGLKQINLK